MRARTALVVSFIVGAIVIAPTAVATGGHASGIGSRGLASPGGLALSSRSQVGRILAMPGVPRLGPSVMPVAAFVTAMAFDASNGDVYVANWDSTNVTVINGTTGSVVAEVAVGLNPEAITVDAATGSIYVANSGSGNVSVISGTTNTVSATIIVGTSPCALAVDAANGDVYVANFGSGNVSVISDTSETVVASISVATSADVLGVDVANGYVYVGNYQGANWLNVVNGATNTAVGTVPIYGGTTWSLAVDPGNGEIYVPINGSGRVAIVDGATDQEVSTITVGGAPRALAVDPVNDEVYIANLGTANVSVVSGTTNAVIATIPVGLQPTVVAVDTVTNDIYVANRGSNNVTVINGSSNTIVDSISTGSEPGAIAIDPVSGEVFVSNYGSSNVSVIASKPPSIQASFTESNVHSGTCDPFSENVTLTGLASGGVPPYNFTWSFGPGAVPSYGAETNHTYTATGSYTVTLSVTDSERVTVSVTQTVDVPALLGCSIPTIPMVGGSSSNLPWQLYGALGGTVVGLALLGVAVWSRRK